MVVVLDTSMMLEVVVAVLEEHRIEKVLSRRSEAAAARISDHMYLETGPRDRGADILIWGNQGGDGAPGCREKKSSLSRELKLEGGEDPRSRFDREQD
jgi:hypothetical protein